MRAVGLAGGKFANPSGVFFWIWTLLALSIATATLASLVPIPGGGTALSSVGLSGALTGFGVPTEAAVAAVLLNQVVVSYLPAIPGWFATEAGAAGPAAPVDEP